MTICVADYISWTESRISEFDDSGILVWVLPYIW